MSDPVVVQGTAIQEDPNNNQSDFAASFYGTAAAGPPQQQPAVSALNQQSAFAASFYADSNMGPLEIEPTSSVVGIIRTAPQRGERQATKCRDPFFAFLGWANVIAISVVCGIYGPDAFSEATGNTNISEYQGYLYAVLITGTFSLILSGCMLLLIMQIPTLMIKSALVLVVVLSGVWAVMAILYHYFWSGIFGIIFFLISLCYARAVWPRIPFAAANMLTACTAVRSNWGVIIISLLFVAVAFGWALLWVIALLGVWDQTFNCSTADGICAGSPNYFYLFLLFLSFFFGHQIIQNTLHVTVAGVVGTWWFEPEEGKGCCGAGVRGSFCRSITTSFGSICFGSLVVAFIKALKQLAYQSRAEGGAGVLACCAQCILGCLEYIFEYFNQWAFVYVGIYGYSYAEAGKNVITLFKNRGWDAIIADDLVGNVLFMVSVIVGLLAGVLGVIVEGTSDIFDIVGVNEHFVAFILGLGVGIVLCSIFLSPVDSAVNAVIVLFAEAPAEFQQHYPELSNAMTASWLGTYPGCL